MSAFGRVWVRVGACERVSACVGVHFSIFMCSSSFIFFSVINFFVFSIVSFPRVFHVSCFCVSFLFSIFMFTVFRTPHLFFLSLCFVGPCRGTSFAVNNEKESAFSFPVVAVPFFASTDAASGRF